jgi:hypothetical protein
MSQLWRAYDDYDPLFVLGIADKAYSQLIKNGIFIMDNLFPNTLIKDAQIEYDALLKTKKFDTNINHLSFDGNNGENCLEMMPAVSTMITNKKIRNIMEGYFGQPVRLAYEKLYTDRSLKGYKERAYYPHHDGYSKIGLKVMILLSDVKEGTLGMQFCAGTHLVDWPTTRSLETKFSLDYWNKFKHIDCYGKAGTVIIFNPNAIHSGFKDMDDKFESHVIVVNFQPGIFRCYDVSKLHKTVVDKLSIYEKLVYRCLYGASTSTIIKNCDTESDLIHLLNRWRRHVKDTIRGNDSVNKESYDVIMADKIKNYSKINKNVLATTEIKFKEKINETLSLVNNIDSIMHLLKLDLDLPIRMYCPISDFCRDNAITRIRDGKIFADIKRFVSKKMEMFDKKSWHDISMDKCLQTIQQNVGSLLRYTKFDQNVRQLLKDLIEILSRPDIDMNDFIITIMWLGVVVSTIAPMSWLIDVCFDFVFLYASL